MDGFKNRLAITDERAVSRKYTEWRGKRREPIKKAQLTMFNWSLGEQRACGAETRFKEMIWELRKNDENQQATS